MGRKRFTGVVQEVHSGDDLIILVNLGVDGLFKRVRVRLAGADTPDAYNEDETSEAAIVRDNIRRVAQDKHCIVDVTSFGPGGWKAIVLVPGEEGCYINLNQMLIDQGYIFKKSGRATNHA